MEQQTGFGVGDRKMNDPLFIAGANIADRAIRFKIVQKHSEAIKTARANSNLRVAYLFLIDYLEKQKKEFEEVKRK